MKPESIPEFIRAPFPLRTDADLEQVEQIEPELKHASDAELDRLIHIIDVLRLQRAMTKKRELERMLNSNVSERHALLNQLDGVCSGIDQLKARGVSL